MPLGDEVMLFFLAVVDWIMDVTAIESHPIVALPLYDESRVLTSTWET